MMRIVNIHSSNNIYISYCFGIIINDDGCIDGDIYYMKDNAYMSDMFYDKYTDLYVSIPNGYPVMKYSSAGRLLSGSYIKSAEYI